MSVIERRGCWERLQFADVLKIRDKAAAIKVYMQSAGESLAVQNQAAEIKLRAERKAGALLAEMELTNGGKNQHTRELSDTMSASSLSDLGITPKQSSRWQAAEWIDQNQLGRRNLNPEQASLIRGRIYNRRKKSHGGDRSSSAQNEHLKTDKTAKVIAKETGVSSATIKRDAAFAAEVERTPELKAAVVPDIRARVV